MQNDGFGQILCFQRITKSRMAKEDHAAFGLLRAVALDPAWRYCIRQRINIVLRNQQNFISDILHNNLFTLMR
jgi:hypothetical protein